MIKLWNQTMPHRCVEDAFEPYLTPYDCDAAKTAIVVCPGGAYCGRADYEGNDVGAWLNTIGITAFVLEYRVAPSKAPAQPSDAQRAMRLARKLCMERGIERLGIMGFSADDTRIRDSFAIATDRGLGYSFTPNEVETDIHPNTVDIRMENAAGQVMTVRGESLGGGKVRIVRINGVEVDFTGEYNALIVVQQDKPGVVAHITKILSDRGVNIAFMRLFREEKGHTAYTIVESDERLPEGVDRLLLENPNIRDVMVVQQ